MTPRLPIAVLAALLVAGCATVTPSPPQSAWTLQISATAGAALVLRDNGRDTLRLACRRDPGELFLASDRLRATRQPVVMAVGGHKFTLRSDPAARRLEATSAMPDELPAALMATGAIRVATGRQSLERLPLPEGKTVAAFMIACRSETANG